MRDISDAFTALVESPLPCAIVTAHEDPLAMRFACVNDAFCRWLERPVDHLVGQPALLACGARLRPTYFSLFCDASHMPLSALRSRTQRDGTEQPVEIRVTAIRDDAYATTHYFVEELPRT